MLDYEILLMLDPEAAEERHEEILARTRELIEKDGGSWIGHDIWGRRRLAYEIGHKDEGTYHLLTFKAKPQTLAEVSRVLKITDGVMRHMATRRPKGVSSVGRPAPPPLPEPLAVSRPADSRAAPEEYAPVSIAETEEVEEDA